MRDSLQVRGRILGKEGGGDCFQGAWRWVWERGIGGVCGNVHGGGCGNGSRRWVWERFTEGGS